MKSGDDLYLTSASFITQKPKRNLKTVKRESLKNCMTCRKKSSYSTVSILILRIYTSDIRMKW